MGRKITWIPPLLNKGLEVIEAHHLPGLKIGCHPSSVDRSLMVEFVDGTVLAQMSVPDMQLSCMRSPTRKGGSHRRGSISALT
jgi:1-deoxy-D-xylulose-5-phosphate reductoisomerase